MRTILAALAVMLAGEAGAEPGPIGRWLMSQPVTLWDRGMDRADAAAKRAERAVGNAARTPAGAAWAAAPPAAHMVEGDAYYDWNANEITLRMAVIGATGTITHERCNDWRRGFMQALAFGFVFSIEDDGSARSVAAAKELFTEKIDGWFSHSGYVMKDRDTKLGEKLAQIVFVEVAALDGKTGKRTFECRGRILEHTAASKPSG